MTRAVLSLPIASIAIGERVGFFNAAQAAYLGTSMAAEGQHDPIHVRRNGNAAKLPWTLVAGLHRLRGAAGIAWGEIEAIQVADASATRADLRRLELSENLDHRQRRPIERAIFMVARASLEEVADYPTSAGEASQVRAARARWHAEVTVSSASLEEPGDAGITVIPACDWRERTALAMCCSVASLKRYQRIHREIVEVLPDLAQALNDHPLGESLSSMTQIAAIGTVEGRRKVIEVILADDGIQSVDAAKVAAKIGMSKGDRPATDAHDALVAAHWDRMTLTQRRSFAVRVADTIQPSIAREMIATFKQRGLLADELRG